MQKQWRLYMKRYWRENNMVDMYFNLVVNGRRTCDEKNTKVKLVPYTFLAEVQAKLKAEGFDNNGKKLK